MIAAGPHSLHLPFKASHSYQNLNRVMEPPYLCYTSSRNNTCKTYGGQNVRQNHNRDLTGLASTRQHMILQALLFALSYAYPCVSMSVLKRCSQTAGAGDAASTRTTWRALLPEVGRPRTRGDAQAHSIAADGTVLVPIRQP